MKRILFVVALVTAVFFGVKGNTPYWITVNDTLRNEPNTWIEFKKDFELKKVPKRIMTRIAADTKYWLWLNDSLVIFEGGLKRGPNPKDTYYDTIDISSFLKKGNNNIRLLLWHFGKPGFSHVNSGKSGVIFDAEAIGLVSDSTWESARLSSYQTATNPSPNYRLPESNIRYDARLAEKTNFAPSIEIGEWGISPWNNLIERPIPQWKNSGIQMSSMSSYQIVDSMTIVSVRLPYNMQITPYIDVTDSLGGTVVYIETDHVRGGSQNCIRAEYVTRPGRQAYESLGWMNGDELRIRFPEKSGLKINGIGYRETGYDCDFEGCFESNDDFINSFWEKAMRTLYVNMRDSYFDCPDRERAQWWGDVTILMGQSFYQLSPKANALMSKAIHELIDWQKDDGVLFSPIPAENWDKELPAQSLAAISTYGLWYYYMHTGDKEILKYAYPSVKKYLSIWKLDSDGLTEERKGGWSWGDWGTDIDMRLLLAAWHYLALQSAINIAEITDNQPDVADFRNKMESIKDAFNSCWNGYAYRHPSYNGATDDRVQALAILSGIADESKYEPIYKLIQSQEYASPYMEKYVMEALMEIGHGDYAMERFKKRFGSMVTDTIHTTLYEGWKEGGYGGGSVNHAWSGGMLTVIAEEVCGVKPLKPGWREFSVQPKPIMSECAIEIPTVKGKVKSSFSDKDDKFILTITVPAGTIASVKLPEENYEEIYVNDKLYNKTNFSLTKGKHKIVCTKTH